MTYEDIDQQLRHSYSHLSQTQATLLQQQEQKVSTTSTLNQLTFPKAVVIERLQANLQTHATVFEEALDGYRKRMEQELKDRLKDVKAGNPVDMYIKIVVPENHSDEYANIIEMLQLSDDETVNLTINEYRQYMRDSWPWKNDFATTANQYGSVTSLQSYGNNH